MISTTRVQICKYINGYIKEMESCTCILVDVGFMDYLDCYNFHLPNYLSLHIFYSYLTIRLFWSYAVDFTLEELKTLRTKQRYTFRDQQYNG